METNIKKTVKTVAFVVYLFIEETLTYTSGIPQSNTKCA